MLGVNASDTKANCGTNTIYRCNRAPTQQAALSSKQILQLIKCFLWGKDGVIPVAARYKTLACGRSVAGIVGSNPAGDMDVSLVNVVCCQVRLSAWGGGSLVQRSPTECGVSECDREASVMREALAR
jgi:hypothetical protein